jgi:hypothetical protein
VRRRRLRRRPGGSIAWVISRWNPFLNLETQILHNGAVAGVVLVAGSVEADHTLALLLPKSFLPTAKVIIEGLGRQGLVRILVV